jgi:hypothetical protein
MPDESEPPDEYHCPYCGEAAGLDQWYTTEQIETIQAAATGIALPKLRAQLEEALAPLNQSGLIQANVTSHRPSPPPPLFEADDMVAVASPCHPYEPVKVDDSWDEPLHCLVCGSAYLV